MSIEDILQALDDECRTECRDIFHRAEQEAKQIMERAQAEAEAIRRARLEKLEAEARSESISMLYSARLRSKNAVIAAKERIAEEALREAEGRLEKLRERADYRAILEGLVKEGLTRVSGKVVVRVDPADRELADGILREMGLDYDLRDDIGTLGGAVVSDAAERVTIINTVEERLNRAREKLRMQVSKVLFEGDAAVAAGGG